MADEPAQPRPSASSRTDCADGPPPKRRREEAGTRRPKAARATAVLRLEPVARRIFACLVKSSSSDPLELLPCVCRGFGAAFSPRLRLRRATFDCREERWAAFQDAMPGLRLRKLTISADSTEGCVKPLREVLEAVCASPGLRASLAKLALKSPFSERLRPSHLESLPHLRSIQLQIRSVAQAETILLHVAPPELQTLKIKCFHKPSSSLTKSQLKVVERFADLRRLGLPVRPVTAWDALSTKAMAQLRASLVLPLFRWGMGRHNFQGPDELAALEQVALCSQSRLASLGSLGSLVTVALTLRAPSHEAETLNESLRALSSMGSLRELQLVADDEAAVGGLAQWTRLSETRLLRLSLDLYVPEGRKLPQLWAPQSLRSFRLHWPAYPPLRKTPTQDEDGPMLPDSVTLPSLRSIEVIYPRLPPLLWGELGRVRAQVRGPAYAAGLVVGAGRRLAALQSLHLHGRLTFLVSSPSCPYSFHLTGKEVAERGGLTAVAGSLRARLDDVRRRKARSKAEAGHRRGLLSSASERKRKELETELAQAKADLESELKQRETDQRLDFQRRLHQAL